VSVEIPVAFVQQYKNNVLYLAQQKRAKLREWVRTEDVVGKAHHFERIGPTEMVQRTTRHADTPLVSTPHSRRRVTMDDWEWADLVDNQDQIRLLIDPASHYAINGAKAAGRRWDRTIIAAVTGPSYSMDANDAATTVALPGSQIVAVGTTGLSMTKVREAKFKLDDADVDEDDRVFVCSPKGMQQLLNDTTVTSSDFNTIKALVDGTIADRRWMGFHWVTSSLLAKTGNVRSCLAWQKDGMGLALGKDVMTRIGERADKSYATQVYLCLTVGAVRIEEARVVQVDIDESV
jgi:hypothetical protein